METNKKQSHSRLYSIVAGISAGICAGLVLGGITLSEVPLQGILLRNIAVLQNQSSSSSAPSVEIKKQAQQRLSPVTRRMLRIAARKRAQKLVYVTTSPNVKNLQIPKQSSESSKSIEVIGELHNAAEASSSEAPRSAAPVISQNFPAFGHTSFPVPNVPNWGAMHSPDVWNRSYKEMTSADFVAIPKYDMSVLTTPMSTLTDNFTPANEAKITAKLFYSTRFLGSYDIDKGEYTGDHTGIDMKLPIGTPIGAIAGGRVSSVTTTQALGLHVIIEHRLNDGTTVFSVYGHLGQAAVKAGDDLVPGQYIGNIGMTGNTSGAHLHLQIDRGTAGEAHEAYLPAKGTPLAEKEANLINPITFITEHRND